MRVFIGERSLYAATNLSKEVLKVSKKAKLLHEPVLQNKY